MSRLLNDFNQSLHKGFIDKHISHKGNYTPKLLVIMFYVKFFQQL